jgi:AcrR family transcriptional regulator
VGFGGLAIEGVAKAANVNRTTIYRRWPSKSALLLAVLEPGLQRFDHDLDTGSVGGDLLALMLMIGQTAALPEGQAVHRAVGSTSEELKELVEAVNERALGAFRRALVRARARGEVGPTDDTEVIAHLAFFGVVLWGETRERAPTEEECRRILRVVLAPLAGSTSAPPARSGLPARAAVAAPSCTTAISDQVLIHEWSPKMDGIAGTIWASHTTSSTWPPRQLVT